MPDKFLPPPFRCDVEYPGEDVARVRPTGDLDMATAPELEERLRDAHAEGCRELIVDLRGLEFMDSAGISLLARWSQGAANDGYDFALVAGSERIQRLFELTSLISHFRFVDG